MEYTIIKETSKYNKSMKYHLVGLNSLGAKFSNWYKTEKDAICDKLRHENRDIDRYTRTVK